MIYWLTQSTANHPDLARGLTPTGLLSLSESRQLHRLNVDKRRREWLLGRWTAKHLIQSYVARHAGVTPPLDAIDIGNDENGAPLFNLLSGWSRRGGPSGGPYSELWFRPVLSFSISHSHDHAFCAMSDDCLTHVGADIEWIEPRSWQLVEDYFTDGEIALVRRTPPGARDTIITLIWSAKESALKALRLGLTVDTRCISCRFDPINLSQNWNELGVQCEIDVLNRHAKGNAHGNPAACSSNAVDCLPNIKLNGWWHLTADYVLTLVVKRNSLEPSLVEVG